MEGAAAAGALSFAGLLRQLRAEARLTQEELAEAAGLSPRSISDLERGINRTARKETALLLAGALGLDGAGADAVRCGGAWPGPGRGGADGQGRVPPPASAVAATRALPRDTGSFTGRQPELARLFAGRRGGRRRARRDTRDRRDGRERQDHPGGARGAPAGRQISRRAVLPSAARPYPWPAAGQPGRRAGQPAADGRRRRACTSRPAARPGPAGGATTSRAKRSFWCSMTRPGMSRSGRCCRDASGSLVLITSRRRLTALEDAGVDQHRHAAARRCGRAAGPAGGPRGPGHRRRRRPGR